MLYIRQLTDQFEKKMKGVLEHITVILWKMGPSFPLWKLVSRRSLCGAMSFPVVESVSVRDKQ